MRISKLILAICLTVALSGMLDTTTAAPAPESSAPAHHHRRHHRRHRHHRHHHHIVVETIYHVSPVYRVLDAYHHHWYPEHHVVARGTVSKGTTANPAAHSTATAHPSKPKTK